MEDGADDLGDECEAIRDCENLLDALEMGDEEDLGMRTGVDISNANKAKFVMVKGMVDVGEMSWNRGNRKAFLEL